MSVAVLLESDSQIGPALRWPLRLCALRGGPVTFVVPHAKGSSVDLGGGDGEADPDVRLLAARLRSCLDEELGAEGWVADRNGDEGAEAGPEEPMRVALRTAPMAQLVDATLARAGSSRDDLLQIVLERPLFEDEARTATRRQLLSRSVCEVAQISPGERETGGEILFTASRGRPSECAAQLALELADQHHRRVTALWVEPDVPDAAVVGRRILDHLVEDALREQAGQVVRRVEIDARPERGILRACADERYDVVIMGSSRLAGSGMRPALASSSVPARVARGTHEPTLIGVRAPVPLRIRALRSFDLQLRRFVPQLLREQRTDLVARVQSNSQWNFDFVLLMGLSTVIATLGLIDDSPAVIIGAMLVAPLMTPLMGLGLAITQGNPQLARMTLRTSVLGFLLAFVIAVAIGYLDAEFHTATAEMDARGWPGELDLAVAFVAGLAAAYASGRPGLLAALPGVAIAAALLPPIAASGLALSVRDYDLALGSMLLFVVNVIAIVIASAVALWATGLHAKQRHGLVTRLIAAVLTATAITMAVGLALATPRTAPSRELVEAVVETLEEGQRLRRIDLRREPEGPVIQIDLGGSRFPNQELGARLREIAKKHVGADAGVRLTYRYETLLR